LGFDAERILDHDQIVALREERPDLKPDVDFRGTGGGVSVDAAP
jgi:hypothetical protein